jgi:hypothetical protein
VDFDRIGQSVIRRIIKEKARLEMEQEMRSANESNSADSQVKETTIASEKA